MFIETFSVEIFLKALLRVFPFFLFFKTPEEIKIGFYAKVFLALALSVPIYARLVNENVEPRHFFLDFLMGLGFATFLSLFFSATLNLTYFFSKTYDVAKCDSWKSILDIFSFILLILFLAHLKIERSILNLLVATDIDDRFFSKLLSIDYWGNFLKHVSLLGLKVSGLGFVFVLSKKTFDEIYMRIGGESMRIVFSFAFFILLLAMSPLIIPSAGIFLISILSSFWKVWFGF
jgi:flagellar biosynthesis protein FliR